MTTELTTTKRAGLIQQTASRLQIDEKAVIAVVKSQCFKGSKPSDITNEQLAAYLSVAESLAARCPGFNPLLPGMLYAYPTKNGGIEPMMGPDCIFALMECHPNIDGWEFELERDENGNVTSGHATIHLKDGRPRTKRVFLSEWKIGSNPNWNQRPMHMLEIRALKQCARQVIYGLPFDEEEHRIANAVEVEQFTAEPIAPAAGESRAEALARQLAEKPAETPATSETDPEPTEDTPEVPFDGAEAFAGGWPREANPFENKEDRLLWATQWRTAEAKAVDEAEQDGELFGGGDDE